MKREGKMEIVGTEEKLEKWKGGKRNEQWEEKWPEHPTRGRELSQKKTSDFPGSDTKYFDTELSIYQKGKKEKQKLSSKMCWKCWDPTLLKFHDLILCKVAEERWPPLSECHGAGASVFSKEMPLSEIRTRMQGMWGARLDTMLKNVVLFYFNFTFMFIYLF